MRSNVLMSQITKFVGSTKSQKSKYFRNIYSFSSNDKIYSLYIKENNMIKKGFPAK